MSIALNLREETYIVVYAYLKEEAMPLQWRKVYLVIANNLEEVYVTISSILKEPSESLWR